MTTMCLAVSAFIWDLTLGFLLSIYHHSAHFLLCIYRKYTLCIISNYGSLFYIERTYM